MGDVWKKIFDVEAMKKMQEINSEPFISTAETLYAANVQQFRINATNGYWVYYEYDPEEE